jgi:ABC-type iron transport system FetAB permease component
VKQGFQLNKSGAIYPGKNIDQLSRNLCHDINNLSLVQAPSDRVEKADFKTVRCTGDATEGRTEIWGMSFFRGLLTGLVISGASWLLLYFSARLLSAYLR